MHKLRYWIRLVLAFVSRFKAIILIGFILGFLIFSIFRYLVPLVFPKNVERIGMTGRFRIESLPISILNLAGEGLTKIAQGGEIEPALATSWVSRDGGKTWEFYLSREKRWQDGNIVTSYDINYEFEGVEIERPDDTTIIFKLEAPFSPFPLAVAHPVFKKGLLGTGDWKVTNLKLASNFVEEIVLRNNNSKKIIRFYPTEDRTKLAFKLGEVDVLSDIINPQPFDNWEVAEISSDPNKKRFLAVFFNTEDKALSDKSLRQALSYAIDRRAFLGERTLGPISPDSWGYNPQVKSYDFDSTRAKKLISDLSDEIKRDLSIKLVTSPLLLNEAELVARYWNDTGIKTQVQVISILPEEYQAFLAMYDIPTDPDQYAIWHSTQKATNISRYKNPRIDKLLEDGRRELDPDDRKKIYLDFQRFLLEDAPAAFLVHPISYTVKRR